MALRVSQTNVAVLAADTGTLRVSSTHVSVLGADTGKMRVSATWVSVLVPALDFVIEDALSFTEEAHSSLITPVVADAMTLTDTGRSNIQSFSLASDMDIVDDVHVNMASLSVTHELPLAHSLDYTFTALTVAHDVNLIDVASLDHSIRNLSLSSDLALTDSVFEHYGVANISIVDTLVGDGEETALLADAVNLVFDIEIIDTLSLTEFLFRIQTVTDTLTLTDTVEFSFGILVEDTLELEETVLVNGEYNQLVSTDLGLEDIITYVVLQTNDACTYGLFVGEDDDPEYEPPSATPPTLGEATLTLTWPYVMPTTTLVLRNPEWDNREMLGFTRIVRETRGGTLEVYGDPDWPQTTTLSLTIEGLTTAQAEGFIDFLRDSLGQEIGLLDWENRQWRGIITTPDAEVTDHGKSCRRAITFEFEGELA